MSTLEKYLNRTEKGKSLFEVELHKLKTPVCKEFLKGGKLSPVDFKETTTIISTRDTLKVKEKFKNVFKAGGNNLLSGVKSKTPNKVKGKNVAVLFSGGPAAGGHNVIAGLFDILMPKNNLYGIRIGPKGLIKGDLFKVKKEDVKRIKNEKENNNK